MLPRLLYWLVLFININHIHHVSSKPTTVNINATYQGSTVSSDCTVEFPKFPNEEQSSSPFDIGKAFAWTIVDLLGFVPGVGTIAAAYLHTVDALLLTKTENTDMKQFNDNIQAAFSSSWACTKQYINDKIERIVDDVLRDELQVEQNQIFQAIKNVRIELIQFDKLTTNNEKASYYQDVVAGEIDDLADIFIPSWPNEVLGTPMRCRMYMNELLDSIGYVAWSLKLYADAAGADADLHTVGADLVDLLVKYKECAPYALYDILTNSKFYSLKDISKQLDMIYDAVPFCGYVQSVYELVFRTEKYEWHVLAEDKELYNFTEWNIDECSTSKWISYINDKMMDYTSSSTYLSSDYFNEYEMQISEWKNEESNNMIIYWENTYGHCGPKYGDMAGSCESSKKGNARNSYATRYCNDDSFSQDITKFDWLKSTITHEWDAGASWIYDKGCLGTPCYADGEERQGYTTIQKTHSCPDGSYLTGGRYLIYRPLWDDSIGIGGLQLICSNRDNYQQPEKYYNIYYDTAFNQLNDYYQDDYDWSPWYICPVGYTLRLKLKTVNGCEYSNEHRETSGWWNSNTWREQWHSTITENQKVTFKCVKEEEILISGSIVQEKTLILRMKHILNGTFSEDFVEGSWGLENEHDPEGNTYSIIGNINPDHYRNVDDKLHFRLIYKNCDGSADIIQWKQNPFPQEDIRPHEDVSGYEPIYVRDESYDITGMSGCKVFTGLGWSKFRQEHLLTGSSYRWRYTCQGGWNVVGVVSPFEKCVDGDSIGESGIQAFNGKIALAQSLYLLHDYTLILRLKDISQGTFSTNLARTGIENSHNPEANTYSIIGTSYITNIVENYKADKYELKLIYENCDGTTDITIWRQASWITESYGTKTEIEPISIPTVECDRYKYEFTGLTRARTTYAKKTYLQDSYYTIQHGVGPMYIWKQGWPCEGTTSGGMPANCKIARSQSLYLMIKN